MSVTDEPKAELLPLPDSSSGFQMTDFYIFDTQENAEKFAAEIKDLFDIDSLIDDETREEVFEEDYPNCPFTVGVGFYDTDVSPAVWTLINRSAEKYGGYSACS